MPNSNEIDAIAHQLAAVATRLAQGNKRLAKVALAECLSRYQHQQEGGR